ncbi:hypothetical protein [Microbulbifer sp. TYP-18]|uniref:hypothetical protein n=1 Tax=Microbulbifer sp. TYP-18 TaxID=3230024 RepID=UPI0034C67A63
MARISSYNFAGETPRIDPKLLDGRFATRAMNVELRRGQIAPACGPAETGQTLGVTTQTLYLFNREGNEGQGFWFEFAGDVDVVRGQIAGDTTERTYFTGDGVPKITDATLATGGAGPYPSGVHDLGLPAPSAAPFVTGPDGEPPEGGQSIDTAYIVTFVSARGEEGPPSVPSRIVARWDGATVELSAIPVASGNFVVQSKRIYRAELTGAFQFVAEIPAAQDSFSDSVESKELGESCPSGDWIAPDPNMTGLTALPNGVMLGAFGNTLAFCEPFQPHAWPIRYQLAMAYDFVAAAVISSGAVIATTGKPYLVAGSEPAAMSLVPLDEVHACVSKRSLVDMGEYVIYASPDGLVAVGGTDARLVSEPLILPSQFRERFNPSSIHAYRFEDRYLAFYDNGNERGSFSFSVQEGFRFYDVTADTAYLDEASGELYLCQAGVVSRWGAGPDSPYTWRSKVWPTPLGVGFAAAKIDADTYPVDFDVYADGELLHSLSVMDGHAFRLPCRRRYRHVQFELRGTAPVSNIQLAGSMSEIS